MVDDRLLLKETCLAFAVQEGTFLYPYLCDSSASDRVVYQETFPYLLISLWVGTFPE